MNALRSARALFRTEHFAFAVVLVILFFEFDGLFRGGVLPGWDTPAHFYALSKMALEYLPHGGYSGYLTNWFGGMPLFSFYGPLIFASVALAWRLLPALSIFLVFRTTLFIILFGFSVSFWYFLRTFLGARIARLGIFTSLIFLLYPKILAWLGIGAEAAISEGLFAGIVGVELLLVWLAFLERYRRSNLKRYAILAIVTLAAIVLTHVFSAVAALFFGIVYFCLNFRDRFWVKFVAIGLTAVGLTAFWTVPFIVNLRLTSSMIFGAGGLPITDPLLALFPFDFGFLTAAFSHFNFWALVLLLLTIGGIVALIRRGRFVLPALFISGLVFLPRNYFLEVFPNLPLHYYRLSLYLFPLMLALATAALFFLNEWLKTRGRGRYLVLALVAICLFQEIAYFNPAQTPIPTTVVESVKYMPSYWDFSSYALESEASATIALLSTLDAQRIFVSGAVDGFLKDVGSPHYFDTFLPLRNDQAVLGGLYAESAPLTPFIMSSQTALDPDSLFWADMRLARYDADFRSQDARYQLDRLALSGASHAVIYREGDQPDLAESKMVATGLMEPAGGTPHFRIYRLNDPRPYVYQSAYVPGIYFDESGTLGFRNFALALYAGTSTYDFPVVNGGSVLGNPRPAKLDDFSLIIINGSSEPQAVLDALAVAGHTVILIDPRTPYIPSSRIIVLKGVLALPYFTDTIFEIPPGWRDLQNVVGDAKNDYAVKDPGPAAVSVLNGNEMRFNSRGAVIVNFGYSPAWHGDGVRVFEVTPDEMLIFADGETRLNYGAAPGAPAGTTISIVTVLALIGWAVRYRRGI